MNEIIGFFRKEKRYALFFAAVAIFYSAMFIVKTYEPKEATRPESAALEAYKQAEDRLQAKVKDAGSMDEYFKDRPEMQVWINGITLSIIIALLVGAVLGYQFLSIPGRREQFTNPLGPPAADWKFSLLFKFFVWFFALNVGLSFVISLVRQFFAGDDNFYLLLHTTGAEILSLVLIVWLLKDQGSPFRKLGFQTPGSSVGLEMVKGWTGYLMLLPIFAVVIFAVVVAAKLMHYEPPPHPLVPIFLEEEKKTPFLVYYSLALASISGPFFEEIFFRGFCYPILKQRVGTAFAMVITASFFAVIHESSFAFWPILVLGLGLAYLYEKRGSLWAPITMHITHNIIFLSYFFFSKELLKAEMGG